MSIEKIIRAIILVALHGYEREVRNRCVYFNTYYTSNAHYIEIKRLQEEVRLGGVIRTEFEDIVDLLTHARQTAQISLEDWGLVVIHGG